MKDYHDLYLACDALLLADVFEKLRDDSLIMYYVQVTRTRFKLGCNAKNEQN